MAMMASKFLWVYTVYNLYIHMYIILFKTVQKHVENSITFPKATVINIILCAIYITRSFRLKKKNNAPQNRNSKLLKNDNGAHLGHPTITIKLGTLNTINTYRSKRVCTNMGISQKKNRLA